MGRLPPALPITPAGRPERVSLWRLYCGTAFSRDAGERSACGRTQSSASCFCPMTCSLSSWLIQPVNLRLLQVVNAASLTGWCSWIIPAKPRRLEHHKFVGGAVGGCCEYCR